MRESNGSAILVPVALALVATAGQGPSMEEIDRVRIAEAFRASRAVGDGFWPGWNETPFSILLVTPEHEFLVRHPRPSDEFRSLGYDSLLGDTV